MRLRELTEGVGRIVKGVNTTPDVGPDEIKKQAKKFGNSVDKDGRPPTLSKKVKGSSTNVLYNLGLAESVDFRVDELNVVKTLDFIKQAHGDQLYGKAPYWTHPRAVALTGRKIFGRKFTPDAVKTAFLHDVIEDTNTSLDELRKLEFSDQVVDAVGLLTKDKSLTYADNIKKIISSGNPLAMMVKYADNYENFTGDKSDWDPKKADSSQKKYLKSLDALGDALGVSYHLGESTSNSNACPRTKASSCQCESVNKITEAKETVTAVCVLEQSDAVEGTILLKQQADGPTMIVGKITGLEPGAHGFHIHEFGDLSDGCKSAGGHYNPDGVDHGDLDEGHVGDLGNITANEDGVASFSIVAERVDLTGERSVVGRAIVVHSDVDDLGKGGDEESLKTGNAGDRLACGVITLKETVNENFADGKKKGKSRPGRVKRAGASCNGSVTSLRKRAKNSSGEKAKMYHWCANMKSGKKK